MAAFQVLPNSDRYLSLLRVVRSAALSQQPLHRTVDEKTSPDNGEYHSTYPELTGTQPDLVNHFKLSPLHGIHRTRSGYYITKSEYHMGKIEAEG